MRIFIGLIGIGFCLGGLVHWLIIFGVMSEKTPQLITIYFHSLAVLSPAAGIGLILAREWGRKLGFFIAATQIPAHLAMIGLDQFWGYNSGVGIAERGFDLVFAVFYILFFSRKTIRIRFS